LNINPSVPELLYDLPSK